MTNPNTNPVGYLQEFVQKYNAATFPEYFECGMNGPDHSKEFTCRCIYDGFEAVAIGLSKKQAKTSAASKLIKLLNEKEYFEKFIGKSPGVNTSHSGGTLHLAGSEVCLQQSKSLTTFKNPISLIQEHCQKQCQQIPKYFEGTATLGSGFLCECHFNDKITYGHGITKKSAKTEAAAKMCMSLNLLASSEETVNEMLEDDLTGNSTSSGETLLDIKDQDKNPVSNLQEYCARKKFPLPVYENNDCHMNLFMVSCYVGDINGNGRGTTRKSAKQYAAMSVLQKLQKKNTDGSETQGLPPVVKVKTENSEALEEWKKILLTPQPPTASVLEEYKFSSDSESEEEVKPQEDAGVTLESLSLNDSIVEIEPSSDKNNQIRNEFEGSFHGFNTPGRTTPELHPRNVSTAGETLPTLNDSAKPVISVIEANMEEVIDEFGSDNSVAFAHCISADFGAVGQMSAGVATIFKKKYGKPETADRLNGGHLTYQKCESGAAVYGLITKPKYSGKPKLQDYNEAFKQLIEDFKKSNFKKLICSPMGCVRDKVPLENFATNIVEFQRSTGAIVNIITYDEPSFGVLKNNLPHPEFVKCLRRNISRAEVAVAATSDVLKSPCDQAGPHSSTQPTSTTHQQLSPSKELSISSLSRHEEPPSPADPSPASTTHQQCSPDKELSIISLSRCEEPPSPANPSPASTT